MKFTTKPGKKTILSLLILMFLPGFIYARNRGTGDTICFRVPTFQNGLDSLVKGNLFLNSFKKYETENSKIISGLKPGIMLNDSLILSELQEMKSVVKIAYNDTVKQYIDLLISKRPTATCALLGLSDYYVPKFREIFAKYKLPPEFAYLPSYTSIYNPNTTSQNGATGYWKMTYLTGKMFNLEINSMVDDRKDMVSSTDAAARYMKELYSLYNDWTLALTAFVSGPGNVNKAIRRANGKTDFWSLYPFLPRADRDYVPAFVAITYIAEHHCDYGLCPFVLDFSGDIDTLQIPRKIHFQQISDATGMPIQEIRNMNPQYKRDVLPSQHKSYVLRLPSEYASRLRQKSDSIFRYNQAEEALATSQNQLLFHSGHSLSTFRTRQGDTSVTFYTVRNGDSLGAISGRFHVSVEDMKSWNHLRSNTIVIGQKLIIHASVSSKNKDNRK